MDYNIEHERKLIKLLGYNLSDANKSNRFIITDTNNNEIGYIQYKKIFKANKKKNIDAVFGYQTSINSDDIIYHNTRVLKKTYQQFYYEFDIKKENNSFDHIEINIGENPNLDIRSKSYGFSCFKINDKGLHLSFKSKTEKFNVEEIISFRNSPRFKEYVYQIIFCDKDKDINESKGTKSYEIIGSSTPFQQKENKLTIKRLTIVDNKIVRVVENEVEGSVLELAMKNDMAIDSFNYFKEFINSEIPFKEDIISIMTKNVFDLEYITLINATTDKTRKIKQNKRH